MKNEKNTIDGYQFADEEALKEARHELEGIEYLRKRTKFSNPDNVFKIYNTVIEKQLFKTPIGYEFLKEMQDVLYNSDKIDNDQIKPIPVIVPKAGKKKLKFDLPKMKKVIDFNSPFRTRFYHMLTVNIVLVIILILFVIISNNSNNLNIINYKARLDTEYSEKADNLAIWEKELSAREESLDSEKE